MGVLLISELKSTRYRKSFVWAYHRSAQPVYAQVQYIHLVLAEVEGVSAGFPAVEVDFEVGEKLFRGHGRSSC